NHALASGLEQFWRSGIHLVRRGHKPSAESFGQYQLVAGPGRGVRKNLRRVNDAGDGHAELDLGIAHGVAADDDRAGRLTPLRTAAQNLTQPVEALLVVGEAHQVQGGLGRAGHRVDVAQGVRRRDLTVDERIIDDRWEEIDSLDDGDVVREAVHARIVVRLGADEQIRIGHFRQVAQDLRDPLSGELAGSTRTGSVVYQALLPAEK